MLPSQFNKFHKYALFEILSALLPRLSHTRKSVGCRIAHRDANVEEAPTAAGRTSTPTYSSPDLMTAG